ncbi:MAG: PLP-dependent aminotransferase family protein, partial [Jiangellaceae bacterium]
EPTSDISVRLCKTGLMWSAQDLDERDGSKTEQVAALVVRRIERGRLAVGSRLPSERDLAARLGLSRVTVVRALDSLRARGVLTTKPSSGTVVSPADRLLDPIAPSDPTERTEGLLDLRFATTAAPYEVVTATQRVVRDHLRAAMTTDGSPPGGSQALRVALAAQLTERGLPTLPSQLTLTVGAAAGLELLVNALDVGPGTALTESPTYPGSLSLLRTRRLSVVGWPAGPGAWDPDQLAHLIHTARPKVVYLQVDNHNPTGASLPAEHRSRVVELCRRAGAVLISDETMRPIWFDDGAQPAPLSRHRGVISIGSFSKTVWGGLRVGWVRAPQHVTARLHASPTAGIVTPSAIDELVALEILGRMDDIVTRRCRILRTNLDSLHAGLRSLDQVAWQPQTGGLTLWLELLHHRPRRVIEAARQRGLLLAPIDAFTPDGQDTRHLRIPITAAPDHLRAALGILAETLYGAAG